jgi:ferredoxin
VTYYCGVNIGGTFTDFGLVCCAHELIAKPGFRLELLAGVGLAWSRRTVRCWPPRAAHTIRRAFVATCSTPRRAHHGVPCGTRRADRLSVPPITEAASASWTVRIDRSICQGHGNCVLIAPDLFEMSEHVLGRFEDEVPDGKDRRHADRAEQGTKKCEQQVARKDAESDHDDAQRGQGVEA